MSLHRILRTILILLALGTSAFSIYMAQHYGTLIPRTSRFPVPAHVPTLGVPLLGLAFLWMAMLGESHKKERRLGAALLRTLRRLWWTIAFLAAVIVWIWLTNRG